MLNREDAKIAADQVNEQCRKVVRNFVMSRADLPKEQFEMEARSFLEAAYWRTLDLRGGKLDDLDELLINGYWCAMWRIYYQLRAAGAGTVGRA